MDITYNEGTKIPERKESEDGLFNKEWDELPIGILKEDGTIEKTSYQLKNIHEFVRAFYLTNTDEVT